MLVPRSELVVGRRLCLVAVCMAQQEESEGNVCDPIRQSSYKHHNNQQNNICEGKEGLECGSFTIILKIVHQTTITANMTDKRHCA